MNIYPPLSHSFFFAERERGQRCVVLCTTPLEPPLKITNWLSVFFCSTNASRFSIHVHIHVCIHIHTSLSLFFPPWCLPTTYTHSFPPPRKHGRERARERRNAKREKCKTRAEREREEGCMYAYIYIYNTIRLPRPHTLSVFCIPLWTRETHSLTHIHTLYYTHTYTKWPDVEIYLHVYIYT